MLISEYLAQRNAVGSITTGNAAQGVRPSGNNSENSFAEALDNEIKKRQVDFSAHAIRRLESRQIDVIENDKMERLNKGVEIAAEKGSEESLILIDSTAFVVSVKNNKVITTVSADDLKGNIFTNIDSTVII
ncbi:MAG: hypothetical protein IJX15_00500 [Ruminiclostridium sp.]|nr:hypothetical protein [Ruminiclostridium sp.]MBQ8410200.1 hypothetical protein [Ruminiclostridium sp.]MBQ8842330.1 hypothetical protein [Ruminiclostridium sp.]